MEYRPGPKADFFKLYFGAPSIIPPSRIYIYYKGRPLYCPAVYEKDRYSFALPKGLDDKMRAGELIADFTYADLPSGAYFAGKRLRVPQSIFLSDRYE